MGDFYVKVHYVEVGGLIEKIVAICDKELIGKKYEEGDLQLYVNPRFYGGEEMSEEEILDAIENATIINLVGEKSVSLGLKLGIVLEENIIRIANIPHAQVVVMV